MKDNVGSYITTDVTRQHPSSWGYDCELGHLPKTPSRSCWRNGNNDSAQLKPEKLRNKQNYFSYFGFEEEESYVGVGQNLVGQNIFSRLCTLL
jgi:hypothetical protein